jgi:hypothetical protein
MTLKDIEAHNRLPCSPVARRDPRPREAPFGPKMDGRERAGKQSLHFYHIDAKRKSSRSAECRKRKIKCDESHPQCGQCRRRGRPCSIIDSLFRSHHFTFSAPPGQSIRRRREAGVSPDESVSAVSAQGQATDVSTAGSFVNRQGTCKGGRYGFSSTLLTRLFRARSRRYRTGTQLVGGDMELRCTCPESRE